MSHKHLDEYIQYNTASIAVWVRNHPVIVEALGRGVEILIGNTAFLLDGILTPGELQGDDTIPGPTEPPAQGQPAPPEHHDRPDPDFIRFQGHDYPRIDRAGQADLPHHDNVC